MTGPHLLLLYDYVDDIAERRGPYREAHLAAIRAGVEKGRIALAGALGEPITGGAIVFAHAEMAEVEAFVAADPYVAAGLVSAWRVVPWNVVASM